MYSKRKNGPEEPLSHHFYLKTLFKNPVSPPSYEVINGIFSTSIVKVSKLGFTSKTPALKQSGGKTSGAAPNSTPEC